MTERHRLEGYKLRRIQEARVARMVSRLSTFNPRPKSPEILQYNVPDLTPTTLVVASSGLLRIQKDLKKLKEETYASKLLPMFQVERGDVTKEVTHEVVPSGEKINIFSGFTLISRPTDLLREHHLSVYQHQTKKGLLTSKVWCIQWGWVDSTTWQRDAPGVIFIFKKKPFNYVIKEIYRFGEEATFSSSSIGEWTKHTVPV